MTFFLRELDGTNGFIVRGTTLNFSNQISISNLGDVNGDGIDDFIIGSQHESPVTTGTAFVIFGDNSMAGFPTNFDLSTLDGTNGFMISGVSTQDFFGRSVSGIGDINGDGIDDILIGAHGGDPAGAANAGRAYVVFGVDNMSSFPANFDLTTLNGTNGFVINGETVNGFMASTVSSIGDINGDGYADVIMGSFANTGSQSIYVVLGQNGGFSASIDVSALNGTDGFALHGITFADAAGTALASAGDINGDGYDDIIIGAHLADPNGSATGEAYVFLGRDDSTTAFTADFNLSDLLAANGGNGSEGFVINGLASGELGGIDSQFGTSISGVGDFNNDGFDDYVIGAPRANGGGQTFVVYGRDNSVTAFDAEYEISDLLAANGGDGSLGFVLQGINTLDLSGWSVSDAGDINGDGFADILIGATGADRSTIGPGGPSDFGQAYVIFGTATNFGASLDLSSLDGTRGFAIEGIDTLDNAGYDVSAGGDINGDGFDDILIAADGPTQPGTFIREMGYVIYGSATIGQNAAPVISGLEPANAVFEERGPDISISDLIEFTDADNNFIVSVTIAITGNHDVGDDSILATVAFPAGITGSYNAAAGVYTLQGAASPAAYQTAIRLLTYRNSFLTQSDSTRTLTITIDDGSTTTSITRDIDMVIDNTINSTALGESLAGGWGNDILNGFGGNDTLAGNAGDDIINGGDGNDGLFAGGPTVNDASFGTDTINGGAGNDSIHGDQGIDTLNGDSGIDTLHGGDNDDFLNGGTEGDVLNGDAGNDTLHGDEGNDTVNGGADNDMVYGDVGNDTLNGNDGDDSLFGGLGDDLLEGGAGADAMDGGAGTDTVTYITSTTGVSLHMISGGTGGDATGDSFTNIEILTGSNFVDNLTGDTTDNIINGAGGDDTISGGPGADALNGDLGDDRLFGGTGDDILHGGEGNDIRLDGQAGNDTIYGDNGNDNIFGQLGDDLLYGGNGNDFISGSDGVDTMFGELGDDVMIGGNGNDIMDGGMGIDRVVGGAGDDIVNGGAGTFADRLFGQAGNDTLDGGAGDDFMTGELGNDIFIGGTGNDSMYGSVGMDTLSGGTGNDLLNGGADVDRLDGGTGADKLIGGTGADVFVFDFGVGASGRDTIFDFAQNSDNIEISGGLVYADLAFTLSPNGQHTTISYNGHEIYVKNTIPAQLDAAQFTFIALAEASDTEKALVSEDIVIVGKDIISDDDSFQFTDKTIVSENMSDIGDNALYQDAIAELLSYAETQNNIYINAEAVFETGYDADISYYTDFFNFA